MQLKETASSKKQGAQVQDHKEHELDPCLEDTSRHPEAFQESNRHLHVLSEEANVQHLDMCLGNSSLPGSNT